MKDSSNNPISGVKITFTNGMGFTTTNTSGFYSRKVNGGWSGTVTPSKTAYTFTPASRTYSSIASNMAKQNYAVASTTCIYAVSPVAISSDSSGRTGSISITTASGCNWIASANASWITITPSSGSGNGSVSYSVDANSSTSSRTGTITVAGKTVTIIQSGTPCTGIYSISPTSKSFVVSGENSAVSITAPNICSWTATSNDSWISITSGLTGTGNGTVAYSVDANPDANSRTGTLTIAGQTFTVSQAGLESVRLKWDRGNWDAGTWDY